MSLLAPLYVLGALAVALPVLFHLIRRQIKERTPFSTLMFLPVSQPRLTRRKRLENLPLLLLRALALILLALAFSRPFLRSTATDASEAAGRRVVVLVDTSASMRRDDLWDQALAQFRRITAELSPGDALAVIVFDSEPQLRLDFDAASQLPLASLRSLGDTLFADEQPSWRSTDLAAALRLAAELAGEETVRPASVSSEEGMDAETSGRIQTQLILISDMQSGADLDSLQGYSWPKGVPLDIRRIAPSRRSNAWLTLPSQQPGSAEQSEQSGEQTNNVERGFRVRVSNAPDSTAAQFGLRWVVPSEVAARAQPLSVQVPPGQSKIVRMSAPPDGAIAISLFGDDHDFDNTRYFASDPPVQQTLLFVGDDPLTSSDVSEAADDARGPRESLFFYLQRLSLDAPGREVTVRQHKPVDGPLELLDSAHVGLVIASGQLAPDAAQSLRDFMAGGGRVLYVLPPAIEHTAADSSAGQRALRLLSGDDAVVVGEASVRDYAILARIDFTHPLFVPLADPRYNDFSKIRFWAHRTVDSLSEDWKVLASFDNGSPALLQKNQGDGRLWVLTVGWQPVESQLALSTKFIPLMYGFYDAGRPAALAGDQLQVGDPFAGLPGLVAGQDETGDTVALTVHRLVEAPGAADELVDSPRIERPGVYRITAGEQSRTIAVNLAEQESRTDPMGDDELERLGVMLGKVIPDEIAAQSERQLRDVELESQQRIWQWLLIGVLGLLGAETLLGGWLGRGRGQTTPAN